MTPSIIVLIPAYNPSSELSKLVDDLFREGARHIVVVNDGSDADRSSVFVSLRHRQGVDLLEHPVNRGKGAALKTGLRFISDTYPDCLGVVTADADGQHTAADVGKIAQSLAQHPQQLILGSRDFSGVLPWRSWFGNVLTRKIFFWQTGQRISDTQTGLRGIPQKYLSEIVKLPGEGYEYEMNVLLWAVRAGVTTHEEKISTIYTPGNSSSHFHPFWDSVRIYAVLLRFALSSILAALIDVFFFQLTLPLTGSIIISMLFSRYLIGSLINFTINRSLVFHSQVSPLGGLFRYYLVATGLALAASGLVVVAVNQWGWSTLYGKIVAETLLFPLSFWLQRHWVFAYRNRPSR